MITLGLGSNLGNRTTTLTQALRLLEKKASFQIEEFSPLYESNALLPDNAPTDWDLPFLNMVVSGSTPLSPNEFLIKVKEIESLLGRKNSEKWAPRLIDIDLLTWNEETIKEDRLSIPHPEIENRPFVLLPLADINPEWIDKRNHALSKWADKIPFQTKRTFRKRLGSEIVGILNVTPDSFSDGGKFLNPEIAFEQAKKMIEQGATVLDIGAESTRPGALAVSQKDEWSRLEPVLKELISSYKNFIKISIDTKNHITAEKSLEMGVDMINDVTGFENSKLIDVVKHSDCDCIVMHSLGVPPSKNKTLSLNEDPVFSLIHWANDKLDSLEKSGIKRDRIVIDPGVSFGKTAEQSLSIISRAEEFTYLDSRILIGHSRKSFFNLMTDEHFSDRDDFTVSASIELWNKDIDYIRVHNVAAHEQAFLTQFAMNSRFIPS